MEKDVKHIRMLKQILETLSVKNNDEMTDEHILDIFRWHVENIKEVVDRMDEILKGRLHEKSKESLIEDLKKKIEDLEK